MDSAEVALAVLWGVVMAVLFRVVRPRLQQRYQLIAAGVWLATFIVVGWLLISF